MKFDHASFDPFISVSADSRRFVNAPATKASPQPANAYEAEAALLRHNIADVIAEGSALRAEAERFVPWCRWMGEGTASQTWGPVQQGYAADWRIRHRALAATLKS